MYMKSRTELNHIQHEPIVQQDKQSLFEMKRMMSIRRRTLVHTSQSRIDRKV